MDIDEMRVSLLTDHIEFSKFAMKILEGVDMMIATPQIEICKVVDDIFAGKRKRSLISVMPGVGKSMLAGVFLMARGFAINPSSRFIYVSYSQALAITHSLMVIELIETEEYQALFPWVKVSSSQKAGRLWRTTENGGVRADSSGSPITGFRAGRVDQEMFTGCFISDDMLKPDDIYSPPAIAKVNRRLNQTMASRLQHQGIPTLGIMQRLGVNDPFEFMLTGGTGDVYDHLELPAFIDSPPAPYPERYTHGRRIESNIEAGLLWPWKMNKADLAQAKKADPFYHAAQLMQRPRSLGGTIFEAKHLKEYPWLPRDLTCSIIFADTALKTGEKNDYSVFLFAAFNRSGDVYLIDVMRGKWEAPELLTSAKAFVNKCSAHKDRKLPRPSEIRIEDKASGTGLIAQLKRAAGSIQVVEVPRNKDKLRRAREVLPVVSLGQVYLPEGKNDYTDAQWVPAFVEELEGFDGEGRAHDDQVDTFIDACDYSVREVVNGFVYSNL